MENQIEKRMEHEMETASRACISNFLVLSGEQGNRYSRYYMNYTGITFPYSLLRLSMPLYNPK